MEFSNFSVVQILSVVLTVIVSMVAYLKWKYSYWQRKGVPQLKPSFFYGDAKELLTREKPMAFIMDGFYQQFKLKNAKYGGLYKLYSKQLILLDPQLIKQIMLKDFDYFTAHFEKFKSPSLFRQGLFHMRGEEWRDTRKKLTPTFTSAKMKMMFETVLDKAIRLQQFAEKIANQNNGTIETKSLIERFTVDVIGSCGFGIECNSMEEQDSTFLKYGQQVFAPLKAKETIWSMVFRMIFRKPFLRDIEETEQFFLDIVLNTIKYREENLISRNDFLQLMIQLKNHGIITDDNYILSNNGTKSIYSIEEITGHCLLFFVAGYDTSATTMTFVLLELSQNEEIQKRIREEYNKILKKYDGKMTYEGLADLKYTECVINETLRKYPPVSVIPRVCTKQYTIPNSDIIIEKDTEILIPVWSIQRDPDYYCDPEKFDPERFNEENIGKIKKFTYFPFGEGPRLCLGLRFAMMQIKLALGTLVSNFKIAPNERTVFPVKLQNGTFISHAAGDVFIDLKKL